MGLDGGEKRAFPFPPAEFSPFPALAFTVEHRGKNNFPKAHGSIGTGFSVKDMKPKSSGWLRLQQSIETGAPAYRREKGPQRQSPGNKLQKP